MKGCERTAYESSGGGNDLRAVIEVRGHWSQNSLGTLEPCSLCFEIGVWPLALPSSQATFSGFSSDTVVMSGASVDRLFLLLDDCVHVGTFVSAFATAI